MRQHRNSILFTFFPIAILLLLQGCDNNPGIAPVGADGYFVVNEGNFGNSNASISYYDRESNTLVDNVFTAKNNRPLGDQAQSMTVWEGRGYIVVQNSGKIEVIDAEDFSSIRTIADDLESPRYFIGYSATKGYVSDWGNDGLSGSVKVIDLNTNTVQKTIPTGKGANQMLLKGDLLYVANGGGFGSDNTVKIIDTKTDAITGSVTVGDNPNSLQMDQDGNIWVLTGGVTVYNQDFSINFEESIPSTLIKLGSANQELLRFTFDKPGAGHLCISPNANALYFIFKGGVFRVATTGSELPNTALIDVDYYGLAVDPFNGDLIGAQAFNFASPGKIDIYSADGVLKQSLTVGIAPNGCAFR